MLTDQLSEELPKCKILKILKPPIYLFLSDLKVVLFQIIVLKKCKANFQNQHKIQQQKKFERDL